MIAEGIKELRALADEARRPTLVQVPGDPPHVKRMAMPDGTLQTLDLDPPYRRITIERLEDLISMGLEHFDQRVKQDGRLICFYDDHSVQLLFDSENGREHASVLLESSEEHLWFLQRLASPLLEVRDLRHALRVTLRACHDDPRLVEQVSSLAFDGRETAGQTIGRGQESMGRSVLQEVQQPANLPEETQHFNVRRWINPDLGVRWRVDCVLDPDMNARRWFLRPIADSWAAYLQSSLDVVGSRLRDVFEDKIPVYQGTWRAD